MTVLTVVSADILWRLQRVCPTDNYLCTFSVASNEKKKTLRRIISLVMFWAISVTKNSQLKMTSSIFNFSKNNNLQK